MFKKIIALVMVFTMTLGTVTVFAKEQDEDIDLDMKNTLEAEDISVSYENDDIYYTKEVNPSDKNDVENVIDLFQLMPETAEALRDYSQKCIDGEIELEELSVSIHGNPLTKSTKTYVGFKNKTYKDEIISLTPGDSGREQEVAYKNKFSEFLSNIFNGGVETVTEAGVDLVWGIKGTALYKVLKNLPSDAAQAKPGTVYARSKETSLKQKFTYIKTDDGFTLGSRTAMSKQYFVIRTAHEGANDEINETAKKTYYTPSYDESDRAAYYGYVNGGETESISRYIFELKDNNTNKVIGRVTFASADR